jgi:hypothetical protein
VRPGVQVLGQQVAQQPVHQLIGLCKAQQGGATLAVCLWFEVEVEGNTAEGA